MRSTLRLPLWKRPSRHAVLFGSLLTMAFCSATAFAETVQFTPSTEDFLNPDRGVALQVQVGPDSLTTLDSMRANGYTVVWGMVKLIKSESLPGSQRLTEIRDWLERVRTARLKAVFRISYHEEEVFDSSLEPTLAEASAHLDALKQTFSDFDDIILAHQLGIFGAYGEWYYAPPANTDAANRVQLINKYFSVIPSTAFIMVRTVYYRQQYANNGGSPENAARLGHFNDCFMSGDSGQEGYNCYPWPGSCDSVETFKNIIAEDSKTVTVGGETCTDLRNSCDAVNKKMERLGFTFLNTAWWKDSSTGKTNFDYWAELSPSCHHEIRTRLGYRIELVSAEVPSVIKRLSSFKVSFTVRNVGYAPIHTSRPVRIMMLDAKSGDERVYWGTNADPRSWVPGGQTFTTNATLSIPEWLTLTESATLTLAIHDDAIGLQSIPEYSVRLASKDSSGADVWTTNGEGSNVLKANIPVQTNSF